MKNDKIKKITQELSRMAVLIYILYNLVFYSNKFLKESDTFYTQITSDIFFLDIWLVGLDWTFSTAYLREYRLFLIVLIISGIIFQHFLISYFSNLILKIHTKSIVKSYIGVQISFIWSLYLTNYDLKGIAIIIFHYELFISLVFLSWFILIKKSVLK